MEKRIELEIKPQQEGQTIQQILREIVGLTPREIRQIKFRENGILRNGKLEYKIVTREITDLKKTLDSPP